MVVANTLAYYNTATVEGASGDKKIKTQIILVTCDIFYWTRFRAYTTNLEFNFNSIFSKN